MAAATAMNSSMKKFSTTSTLSQTHPRRQETDGAKHSHDPIQKTVTFSDVLHYPDVEVNKTKLDVTKMTRASIPTRVGILSRSTIRSTIRDVNVRQRQQFSVNYNNEWYKSAEHDILDARFRTKQWKF